jgi:hypothetical protein
VFVKREREREREKEEGEMTKPTTSSPSELKNQGEIGNCTSAR